MHNRGCRPSHPTFATMWSSAWQPGVCFAFNYAGKSFNGHTFSICLVYTQECVSGDSARADSKEIRMYVTFGAPASRWTRPVEAVNEDAIHAYVGHASRYKCVILDQHFGVNSDHPIILFKAATFNGAGDRHAVRCSGSEKCLFPKHSWPRLPLKNNTAKRNRWCCKHQAAC